ncbi:haloacid dehalogenase superfamily protein, subfamily IA, variant 3 with third motif having DD or ED [Rivularia sp. PCC 7116]|uniref:HAD family hydrolase n=1 Tax=Rivularia sp. PCC 7116 TaxID=373994 RepID=UPI00029F0EB8|nr:HAD-IA family hydrolase [Rivularia sp. PCC 7116]AFY57740.1 haloacid dehalogenase superfamily protein, subfamily IA, variant 3 with third motif having DD or ED [Rivularia sp. PCC 7116]
MLTAILFDLDGTIVNTDPIHYQIWYGILLEYHIKINENIYKSNITGRLNPDIIRDLLPHLSQKEIESFAEEKEARFREQASLLKPIKGFAKLLTWSKQHHLKSALVTNAPKLNAYFMLEVLQLKEAFDIVILAEEEVAAKPDPTPYKVALERLGVNARETIAIEDSPSGIRSSVSAGIRTVGMTSTQTSETLEGFGAFATISDFTNLQLWTFLNSQLAENHEV